MTSFASEVAYTLGHDVVSNLYAAAEKPSVARWQSGHPEAKAELHKFTYMLASMIGASDNTAMAKTLARHHGNLLPAMIGEYRGASCAAGPS